MAIMYKTTYEKGMVKKKFKSEKRHKVTLPH